ncbi:hypothetical protein F7984_02135 [Pradoshia sp. D12]|uniref:hypothetical protein n=1 Tax=Bacillaceae TaxID=186817 RepID=UPI00111DB083|nr:MULTISPECIES: hypothetical protein [Bacillaceae]QFK70144.1 hypothetical protein F7984_02135 [Pradoshia sp. D12]TPF70924.1 hypothetical protein FHY44_14310 [Bacillus sp. D12]
MENSKFEYIYSAKRQAEIEAIKKKYMKKEDDPFEQLRNLDKSAERPGTILAIMSGLIGTLLFGIGMSCCLVWGEQLLIPGIIIGFLGLVLISVAYPIYVKITKRKREKLAPKILSLSEELLK